MQPHTSFDESVVLNVQCAIIEAAKQKAQYSLAQGYPLDLSLFATEIMDAMATVNSRVALSTTP